VDALRFISYYYRLIIHFAIPKSNSDIMLSALTTIQGFKKVWRS